LDISNKDLRGPLAFGNFINLRKLNASFNNITELYLVANDVLEDIDFSHNQLNFGATS
jgi:Leucine-rich repeat (LRR) protein